MDEQNRFDEWAVLELMGHRRLAGRVTDAVIGGGAFLRIDIPGKKGRVTTQYYSPGSVYCITPTTEAIARGVAEQNEPEPVHRWELPQLAAPAAVRKCRVCGCTEDHACLTADGPCHWVEDDLCSVCADRGGYPPEEDEIP
jgi:hypothetical protein